MKQPLVVVLASDLKLAIVKADQQEIAGATVQLSPAEARGLAAQLSKYADSIEASSAVKRRQITGFTKQKAASLN